MDNFTCEIAKFGIFHPYRCIYAIHQLCHWIISTISKNPSVLPSCMNGSSQTLQGKSNVLISSVYFRLSHSKFSALLYMAIIAHTSLLLQCFGPDSEYIPQPRVIPRMSESSQRLHHFPCHVLPEKNKSVSNSRVIFCQKRNVKCHLPPYILPKKEYVVVIVSHRAKKDMTYTFNDVWCEIE